MDDFGNSITDFCKASLYGFAAYTLCAECGWSCRFASEQYLTQLGVIE